MKTKTKKWSMTSIVMVLLFVVMLVAVASGTGQISQQSTAEGAFATQQAIERAAVLCYASEGFYPPSLDYIEKNYGVQIDYERYAVRYLVFASNIMPDIRVTAR